MQFLIEYDRDDGKIVSIRHYSDSDRSRAEVDRLKLELELRRLGKEHEVVVLEANSEAALRKTHRRYFEDLAELVRG